jgi:hypothetical protein
MQKTAFGIISGYNGRAVLAACRSLQARGAQFGIVARGAGDAIRQSRYRARIGAEIHSQDLELEALTESLARLRTALGAGRLVVLPTAEYLNRFLLTHRAHLEREAGCVLPLPSFDVYRTVSDKQQFAALCAANGLALPAEFPGESLPVFPFAAKPRAEFSDAGKRCYPYLIHDRREYAAFRNAELLQDYYMQEYVHGRSYYLLFYFFQDGRYRAFCQRNGAQQPGGKSVVFAWSEPFPEPALQERYGRVLRELGFRGLVMVELKGSAGNYRMIEANPRLWGPLQLARDSGNDLIACYAEEYAGIPHPAPRPRRRPYLWFNGIVQTVYARERLNWFAGGRRAFWRALPQLPFHDVYLRPDSVGVFGRELAGVMRPQPGAARPNAATAMKDRAA